MGESSKSMKTKTTAAPAACPCGSGAAYLDCCGRFIAGAALPDTAEQLMRSRYSAYTLCEEDYVRATWHPSTQPPDLQADPKVQWLGLKIIATQDGGPEDLRGLVEFVARYKLGGRAHRLHERSRFARHQGRWCYVDGDLSPERGR
jgi:SEC-C motif domain protein